MATNPISGALSNITSNIANAVGGATNTGQTTRINAMISAAATINNKNYPYVWGGGHGKAGTPSVGVSGGPGFDGHTIGYDCSGSVGAVLSAARITTPGGPVPASGDFGSYSHGDPGPGIGTPECTIFFNSSHVFMRLNGKMWGTGANSAGGPGWHDHTTSGFNAVHISTRVLNEVTTYAGPGGASSGGSVPQPQAQQMLLPSSCYDGDLKERDIKVIVLHASEIAGGGGYFSALSNALQSQNRIGANPQWDPPGKGLSVHMGANADGSLVRLVPDNKICYGAVGANPKSLQIEQAGFTTQTSWPDAQISGVAKQVAYWCWRYNIPVKHDKDNGIAFHSDGGAAWGNHGDPGAHYPIDKLLQQVQTIVNKAAASGGSGSGGGGGTSNDALGDTWANAFVAEIQLPSLQDQVTAIALGEEHMGLMHDQSLMPFVQQVCQASMRSFQSLPNGDFYAFYPDYFGEFGHHDPYWLIDDIEILDGQIMLTDDALATHVFAVGDTTWPISKSDGSTGQFLNMLQAATINIQNAFGADGILATQDKTSPTISADEAVQFIKRYGARPLVQQYPMVRSPVFEMFLAYQQFMLAWSNQFKTPFTFTFMPELFPGGKVGFPAHGLQMFINSVTHEWDYEEAGFTTTAELAAPSVFGNNTEQLPPNMVEALITPIRTTPSSGKPSTKKTQKPATLNATQQADVNQTWTETAQSINQAVQNIIGNLF